ncbi:MAG TPA: fructose-6-phosphate aldolase [Blastocatellia bacterium]|nr:fructose-6-phosphate aldolase [Blastocatellia bacterium]
MKFFLDTANLNEIREAASLGILDGVTTNPSLVSKEGNVDFKEHVHTICEIVKGPVSAEVTSTTTDAMVDQGRDLAKIHPNVYVKVPCLPDGIKACRILSGEGIHINVTLVFSAPQAIIAAKAGASFVSPFVGRLDDIGHVGMELIGELVQIFDNYDFQTEILVASVRSPIHVIDAARMGADIATMPFSVITQMLKHPLTDIGNKKFLDDWNAAHSKK